MTCINDRVHHKLLYIAMVSALFSASGHAGVMIGGTRFIYNEENDKGLSILVRNMDDTSYLVQTKVSPDKTKGNSQQSTSPVSASGDFVATPPLLPLKNKRENYIRIIRAGGSLPNDRESLFQLSIAAIPSGKPASNDLQIAMRSRYKLIYRPSGLQGSPEKAYQKLRWQKKGASVTVENPTPYYVTLFQLSVNGKERTAEGVVSPFGNRTDAWCPATGACHLQWQSLSDNGTPTEAWVVIPQMAAQTGMPKNKLSAEQAINNGQKKS